MGAFPKPSKRAKDVRAYDRLSTKAKVILLVGDSDP